MLRDFLQQTTTGKAHFAQIIVDKNLKQLQQATGTMQFARPENSVGNTISRTSKRLSVTGRDCGSMTRTLTR